MAKKIIVMGTQGHGKTTLIKAIKKIKKGSTIKNGISYKTDKNLYKYIEASTELDMDKMIDSSGLNGIIFVVAHREDLGEKVLDSLNKEMKEIAPLLQKGRACPLFVFINEYDMITIGKDQKLFETKIKTILKDCNFPKECLTNLSIIRGSAFKANEDDSTHLKAITTLTQAVESQIS